MRLIFINYMYKQKCEMRRERIQKRSTTTTQLFAIVALSAVTLILASQHASAAVVVHHKVTVQHTAHTVSKVHHKVIAVIPEMHGEPATTAAQESQRY